MQGPSLKDPPLHLLLQGLEVLREELNVFLMENQAWQSNKGWLTRLNNKGVQVRLTDSGWWSSSRWIQSGKRGKLAALMSTENLANQLENKIVTPSGQWWEFQPF